MGLSTVAQKYITVFRFPFAVHLHLCFVFRVFRFPFAMCPHFVPRVFHSPPRVFRFPFAVRPHLCLAFSILRLAFRVFRFPFAVRPHLCLAFPFYHHFHFLGTRLSGIGLSLLLAFAHALTVEMDPEKLELDGKYSVLLYITGELLRWPRSTFPLSVSRSPFTFICATFFAFSVSRSPFALICASRFPFSASRFAFRVFRYPFAVRPHLCLAFSILRLAFSVSRSPFALICASRFPYFYFIIILRNALICERSKFVIWAQQK